MSEPRRVLVALAGAEDPALVAELAVVLGPGGPTLEIRLLHVVDSGPRGLLPIGSGPRRGPWPKPPDLSLPSRLAAGAMTRFGYGYWSYLSMQLIR